MKTADHLKDDLLLCALDDELAASEIVRVEAHLSQCDECKRRYQELRSLSGQLESVITSDVPPHSRSERERLAQALEARQPAIASYTPRTAWRRLGWGMAIAATLALGVLFGPQWARRGTLEPRATAMPQSTGTFEVDGETFVALPYSNPDLPVGAPHIVQMQVPVSSLADAGVVFEPISTQVSSPDRTVLADVLLGLDGQPLGVHVLSAE